MNILYDGILSNLQSYGGITVYFRELISRLNKSEHVVVEYNAQASLSKNSIIRKPRLLERYRNFQMKDLEASVFHSTYYRIPDVKKMPVITTVHDFTYELYVQGMKKKVHSWQKNKAIHASDIIVCVSNNTANDLLKYCKVDEDKIHVIYNGVSEDYFPLNLEATNQVLFVGARSGYKNFSLAVKAISQTKGLFLGIIGGGDLSSKEEAMLNSLLPSRYKYYGKVTNEELNYLYNTAYCLLYPSEYEGFGIPVIEAMRARCPVIAANRSSIPEVAGNSAILLNTITVNNLADALMTVSSCRTSLVNNGLLQANKFSWNRCFLETEQIYKELSEHWESK
ncbi:glycosyltransferase family 4 protein [Franconibacter pulveris]|uniref:glycosyltransferase family 4 protein n=1 Tax=Franconibacter pulveris TaxID=435910 RepID=UPI0008FF1224|nr:glycosyltransferase family 1 protein [Franconibacter pulveris]